MSKIVLNDVTNLNSLSVINDNFDKIEQELQNKVMYRNNPDGEPNTLETDVDANDVNIYNVNEITAASILVDGEPVLTSGNLIEATEAAVDAAESATNSAATAAADAIAANASAEEAAASAASVNAANIVHKTDNETVNGVKTFTSTIVGSVSGNAGTVTNGVYTSGDQTIVGTKTFSSPIAADITGNAVTVTNGVYTIGNQTIAGIKTFSSQPVLPQKLTSGTAVATTSGTAIDFTSIPSWVKRITIMFLGVSTTGSSIPLVQIGTFLGIQSSGYSGSTTSVASSTAKSANLSNGFAFSTSTDWMAGYALNGKIELTLLDSSDNTWACSGVIGYTGIAYCQLMGGVKSLSANLDRIRLTTVGGTDTFDVGRINILYE